MVGTLAFAAPEQLLGAGVTPASDQFSFGVSLHRALEGVAPFTGDDPQSMARAIRSGRITVATDARALPAWLRTTVNRALSAEPAARFPSMPALLAELARPRGWRRWRTPVVVSGCITIAMIALLTRPGSSDPLTDCDRGAVEAGAVWDDTARTRVETALGKTISRDASEARDRVLRGLDHYRDHWIASRRDACVAHRTGEQSDMLFDRRLLCLRRRLEDLRAAVAVLQQPEAAAGNNAVDIVARMPSTAQCEDVEDLQAEAPPPSSAGQRTLVEIVRAHLSRAMASHRAGRSGEALATARAAIAEAEQSHYPPVLAEAALAEGRITLAQLAAGYARLLQGDASGSITRLQQVADANAPSPRWWERAWAAQAELGIGLAEDLLGHRVAAERHLQDALRTYGDIAKLHEWTEYPRRIAFLRRQLTARPPAVPPQRDPRGR